MISLAFLDRIKSLSFKLSLPYILTSLLIFLALIIISQYHSRQMRNVEIENEFQPTYVISPEKRKVVKELKDNAKKAEEVWLATDEDREGEMIAWSLADILKFKLLP